MGQFSWITQDTNEAIRESYGCDDKYKMRAFMHDNKGNVWEEKSYEGYGVFGGKDFYELLAEMNGVKISKEDIDKHTYGDNEKAKYTAIIRGKGIDLAFGKEPFISPNLTRNREWEWKNRSPKEDPNQGWGK